MQDYEILSLQDLSDNDKVSAKVISRKTGSWWRQILNKGSKDGIKLAVLLMVRGLLGRVKTSLFTSSVTLLTSPESR